MDDGNSSNKLLIIEDISGFIDENKISINIICVCFKTRCSISYGFDNIYEYEYIENTRYGTVCKTLLTSKLVALVDLI